MEAKLAVRSLFCKWLVTISLRESRPFGALFETMLADRPGKPAPGKAFGSSRAPTFITLPALDLGPVFDSLLDSRLEEVLVKSFVSNKSLSSY